MPFIAIALIIAAAVGGGTALTAENSLPGDPLWNVKVNVDEKLASMLATSDQAQAELDIADIKTRVSEAQELQAKGQLTAQTQAQISANLDAHAQDAAVKIATLQSSGDTESAATAAADFQAAMASSAANLGQADFSASSSVETQNSLLTDVHTTLNEASALSADASAAAAAKANIGL